MLKSFSPFSILGLSLLFFSVMACQPKDQQNTAALFNNFYGADVQQPGGSLYVAQQGEPVEDYSFGLADMEKAKPNSSELKYRMASVSKHFTAYAVYTLIREGKLTLDTKITAVLKDMNPVYEQVRVGMLLNHTSGILDYEGLMKKDQTEQLSDADVFALVKDEDSTYFTPGSAFRYSNTGFCLLTLIVEQISGKSYADFMKEVVFEPKGIDAKIYEAAHPPLIRAFGYHPDKNGQFRFADQSLTSATKGDGGVYISPEQFSKWSLYIMEEWDSDGSYARLLEQNKTEVTKDVQYSMGWFLLRDRDGNLILAHSGETTGFHNIVVLEPQKKESISLFTNRDDLKIAAAFEEVLKRYSIKLKAVRPGLFNFFAGVYQNDLP